MLFSCVHELTIWRINTLLPNGMNLTPSPAVAGCSGGVSADRGRTEERLRIALLNVDYVTSFELLFACCLLVHHN